MRFPAAGMLVATGLMAACISKPTPSQKLFSLPTSPPRELVQETGAMEGRILGFGPVSVISILDRSFVAIRLSDTQYEFADSLRWASPVETMVQDRLIEALIWATGASDIISFPWSSTDPPDLQVGVRLQRFEITAGGGADIAAYWFIRDGSTRELLDAGLFENHQPGVDGSGESAVRALDRAILALAEEIARQIP